MERFRTQSGMTLIELLLYLGIASVLVVVLSSVSIEMLRAADRSEHQHVINQDLQLIVAVLRGTAGQASAVSEPSPGTSADGISFAMYDAARDPTRIYIEDDVLWLQVGNATPTRLHDSSVEADAAFVALEQSAGIDTVQISLELRASTSAAFGAQQHATYETALTLPFTP